MDLEKKVREITEKLEFAEAELKLKNDALENSLNGFDIVDSKGNFLYANRTYLKMWGYETLAEILGTSAVGHCEDPTVPLKIIQTIKDKRECTLEFKGLRKDGSTFDVQMWARLAHNEKGEEIYPTTSIDISDRKKAEEAKRFQSELNKTVTDNAASCLFIMDIHGHPTFMNPAAHEVTGYQSIDEIKNRPLHYGIHWKKADGSHYPMEECPIDNAQAEITAVKNQEEIFCKKDGTLFPVSYSVMPLEKNGELVGSVLEFRDITEEKKKEKELHEAIRSRDEFLSIASHELKTPLTSLKLQAQSLRRKLSQDNGSSVDLDQLRKMNRIQNEQLNRLGTLIDDMLDISRLSTGSFTLKPQSLYLAEAVKEILERYEEQFTEYGIKVEFGKCEDAKGQWDRHRIGQVIENLITNAMKYGNGKPVKVEVYVENNEAVFSITDQGMGITEDNYEKIFERYGRAISASEISGLGLGLYISKQIVEMHNGRIEVQSQVGQGSTFTFYLPMQMNQ